MKTEHTPTPENTGEYPEKIYAVAYANWIEIQEQDEYLENGSLLDLGENPNAEIFSKELTNRYNSYSDLKAENEGQRLVIKDYRKSLVDNQTYFEAKIRQLQAENAVLKKSKEKCFEDWYKIKNENVELQAENEQLEKDKEKWFEVAKKRTYENEVLMETVRKDTEQIGRLQAENEQNEKRIKELEAALTRFVEFGQKHILESGDSYESAMFRQCKEALKQAP